MTTRAILPNRRPAETFDFEHAGMRFTASVGLYEQGGRLGEVFVNAHKRDSNSDAIMRDAAILASFALQYGATLDALRKAMTRDSAGTPSSPIGKLLDVLEGA
jgi:hypothetical protein